VLIDSFGRVHNNLRISVTDRCNLRCTYCMPEDVTFLDRAELLSFEEMTTFTRIAVGQGINKVRLTGGEPLLRRDLPVLIRQLNQIDGLEDIGLTTNAVLLAQQAQSLKDAGLHRLNISLDTLDEDRFEQLTRRKALGLVLEGIAEAQRVGFTNIKINAVAIRGMIEHDAAPLANYCRDRGIELRFIEYMPIGAEEWERNKLFAAHEILELLETHVAPLRPASNFDPNAPATEFEYLDGRGTVGIIASVTRPFCTKCNRLRLTAEGKLRNCLFSLDEIDIKPLLRAVPLLEEPVIAALHSSVRGKWAGHEINSAKFVKPLRTMHAIGG
jgi:GTP 3',8-cyclase